MKLRRINLLQLSWAGSLALDRDIDLAKLPHHLLASLRELKATALTVKGRHVTFGTGLFRLVDRANVLVPFGSGVLIVDEQSNQLMYEVSLLQFALFSASFLLLITIFLLTTQLAQYFWLVLPTSTLAGIGSLIVGIHRFSYLLSASLATAPRRAAVPGDWPTLP